MNLVTESIAASLPLQAGQARRLFHGRGGRLPGCEYLTIDQYADLLLINHFREPGPEWPGLAQALRALLEPEGIAACMVQQHYARPAAARWAWGAASDEWLFQEAGLNFHIRPGVNRNPGFFLDMAPGRAWLQRHAQGKKVLNLFAYSGSLSVCAFAGGARHVVNVDMSRGALNMARRNHALNGYTTAQGYAVEFEKLEIFRSMGRLRRKGPYDLIVVDPPSYQPGSFVATKDYARLVRKLPGLSADDAVWLLCLNAPELDHDYLHRLVAEACPEACELERLPIASGFTDTDAEAGLKVQAYRFAAPAGA